MKKIYALLIITTMLMTACQPTPEELIVSSKNTDIQQVVIQNNEQDIQEPGDVQIEQQANEQEGKEKIKTDYYQTPETYINQFSKANVDVFIDAIIHGPEDNKIVSVVLEDNIITQELADDFIAYFVGDAELYEKKTHGKSKEEYQDEITYWKQAVFNCQKKWDEVKIVTLMQDLIIERMLLKTLKE